MTEKYSLAEIIESTRRELIKCDPSAQDKSEIDLSYITQELIDEYDKEAKDKVLEISECEKTDKSIPCYWGNSWVYRNDFGKWQYRNGNSENGCDRKSDLCSTKYKWNVKISGFANEYDCIGYWGKSAWSTSQ